MRTGDVPPLEIPCTCAICPPNIDERHPTAPQSRHVYLRQEEKAQEVPRFWEHVPFSETGLSRPALLRKAKRISAGVGVAHGWRGGKVLSSRTSGNPEWRLTRNAPLLRQLPARFRRNFSATNRSRSKRFGIRLRSAKVFLERLKIIHFFIETSTTTNVRKQLTPKRTAP